MNKVFAALALASCAAAPAAARDSLGLYEKWGAFVDREVPRCYAIAIAEKGKAEWQQEPYADIGTWPRKNLRGQVHFRLSQVMAKGSSITLSVGRASFRMSGSGVDAWSADRKSDAAIVAAMRSAESMTIRAYDARGKRISDRYLLAGAASALDAATLGCARLK